MRTIHSKFKGDAEIIVFKIYFKTIELGDNSVGKVLACRKEDMSLVP